MKKLSDRDRALEQPVWMGDSGVTRDDYLARLGLKAALGDADGAGARHSFHQRGIYSVAILACSAAVIGVLLLSLLPAARSACRISTCAGALTELVGLGR